MRVLIGGGSGFVGQYLTRTLRKRGHEVIFVSRSANAKKDEIEDVSERITWTELSKEGLPPDTDAVVNLAGQLLMDPMRRWDESFKRDLWRSRVDTTKSLVDAISSAHKKPHVFVSSSAVGYYAASESAEYTEDSDGGDAGVLGELCRDWEAAAQLPPGCSTRLATVRIGLVLGREGGVIHNLILPFWFGVGGRISSGEQWFPWIHAADAAGIIAHAVENEHVTGVLNATAPDIVTNSQFTKAFGSALWRPTIFPVPAFAINLAFGKERGQAMIEGQRVIPKRTLETGYEFLYPDIQSASKEFARLFMGHLHM